MTRAVRRAELANTVVLDQFACPKNLRPRRRSVRRQAGICAPHLGRPTYVGPQPSTPIRLTGWQTTILLAVATVSFIALLAWAGFHVEPFRP